MINLVCWEYTIRADDIPFLHYLFLPFELPCCDWRQDEGKLLKIVIMRPDIKAGRNPRASTFECVTEIYWQQFEPVYIAQDMSIYDFLPLLVSLGVLGRGQSNLWVPQRSPLNLFTGFMTTSARLSFYNEDCQQYADSAYPAEYQTVNGPWVSRSMLLVSGNLCSDSCCKSDFLSSQSNKPCHEAAARLIMG
jgi:hypothetical protein